MDFELVESNNWRRSAMEGGVAILRRVQEVSLCCSFPGRLCSRPLINSSSFSEDNDKKLTKKQKDIVLTIKISAHVSIE